MSPTAIAVVIGTAATIPMLPTSARTTSTATTSPETTSAGSWRPAANRTMSGQRRADVGEDEGVDRGRDVRAAHVHRPAGQREAAHASVGLVQLLDRRRLGDGHVVEDAQRPEDHRRQHEPTEVHLRTAQRTAGTRPIPSHATA